MKLHIFCKHDYEFDSTIHGDMIIHMGGNRSIWKCSKCGKYKQRKEYISKEHQKLLLRKRKINKIKSSYTNT
jgi:NAD-dependent SIR2 family protein deacetylase